MSALHISHRKHFEKAEVFLGHIPADCARAMKHNEPCVLLLSQESAEQVLPHVLMEVALAKGRHRMRECAMSRNVSDRFQSNKVIDLNMMGDANLLSQVIYEAIGILGVPIQNEIRRSMIQVIAEALIARHGKKMMPGDLSRRLTFFELEDLLVHESLPASLKMRLKATVGRGLRSSDDRDQETMFYLSDTLTWMRNILRAMELSQHNLNEKAPLCLDDELDAGNTIMLVAGDCALDTIYAAVVASMIKCSPHSGGVMIYTDLDVL